MATNTNKATREKFLYPMLELEKVLPWYTGATLRGYTLTDQGEGWLLTVRAELHGKHLVAFQGAHSPFDCWEYFLRGICRKDWKWRPDKFQK